MARSFRKTFEGRELEVLNYINDNGGWPIANEVMKHFGANCVIAWGRFIDDIAQERDFKFAPRDRKPPENSRPIDLQYLDECAGISRLTKTVARLQSQIAYKKQRRDELERRLLEVIEDNERDYEPCEVRIC